MPKHSRRQRPRPGRALKQLFAQPPAAFYGQPAFYWCGQELEIENFCRIVDFAEGMLTLQLRQGRLRILGDELMILALEHKRILLRGRFLRIEFSPGEEDGS